MQAVSFLLVLSTIAFVATQDFFCKDGIMNLSPNILSGIRKCGIVFGEHNTNCKYFCYARILGLLNEETELPSQETYDSWVDREFQEKDRENAKAYFADCFAEAGEIVTFEDDMTCTNAKIFNDCTWDLPRQTC